VYDSTPSLDCRAMVRGQLAKWQARRVHAYVETHLDARLKVSEIAQSVHLSSSHFSRAFKRTFGMTVHAWVMRRRIETAQGMMLSTPHTLSEIALHCGLSDQSHLTRWFRRVVGQTPGSWRRRRYKPGALQVRPAPIRVNASMFSVLSSADATSSSAASTLAR
jgi:AraC family transcriptional regulator